jgi:hypothetical protein
MDNQNTQDKMSPDALAATLAHATNLQEQSMPQAPQEASQEPQEALGAEQPQETEKEASEPEVKGLAKLEGKFEQGIKDLGDMISSGFDRLVKGEDKETEK